LSYRETIWRLKELTFGYRTSYSLTPQEVIEYLHYSPLVQGPTTRSLRGMVASGEAITIRHNTAKNLLWERSWPQETQLPDLIRLCGVTGDKPIYTTRPADHYRLFRNYYAKSGKINPLYESLPTPPAPLPEPTT
jgi:hypothetical protein